MLITSFERALAVVGRRRRQRGAVDERRVDDAHEQDPQVVEEAENA